MAFNIERRKDEAPVRIDPEKNPNIHFNEDGTVINRDDYTKADWDQINAEKNN